MNALKNKPVIIFFSVLLAVIAAAYLLHTINPPQRLPLRIDEINNDSTSSFIIRPQDLYPSALLFEIGSQSSSLEMAEIGARSLADAIATAFVQTE